MMKKLLLCLGFLLVVREAYGQAVPPVNVSTLGTVGSIVTVTTSAVHNLVVNQGFCLSAPANLCSVVLTVPSSTTLTFSGAQTCSTSCGTVQAAKQIIVLNSGQPSTNQWTTTVVFWLTTTQGLAVTPSSVWTGATSFENAAIHAGLFVEQQKVYSFAVALPIATVKTIIASDYVAAQQALANSIQPAQFYGVYFNGAWSQ